MNIKSLLFSLALLLSIFVSCKKDDAAGSQPTPYASFKVSDVEIASYVDELNITITTVDVDWTLSKPDSITWLTLNGDLKGNETATVNVTIEKNTSLDKREAELKLQYIKYGGAADKTDSTVVKTMKLTQLGEVKAITFAADTLYVDSKGQIVNVEVTSNIDWVAKSSEPWLKVGTPTTRLLVGKKLPLTFEANNNPTFRIATVELTYAADNLSSTLIAYQYGESSLVSDKAALVDLYNSTNGASWTKPWDLAADIATWQGVTVGDTKEGTRVIGLDLRENNLIGAIPASIGNLQYLEVLSLFGNNFNGTQIPLSIGDIHFLRYLYLEDNKLEGVIPEALASLQYLERIHLGNNQFSGEIPAKFGEVATNLYVFGMANNNLTGNLPEKLGSSSVLDFISVEGNRLSGDIPASYKSNILWKNWTPATYIYPQQDGYTLK